MDIVKDVLLAVFVVFTSAYAGYMFNQSNVEYYRNLVYALECEKSRQMFN